MHIGPQKWNNSIFKHFHSYYTVIDISFFHKAFLKWAVWETEPQDSADFSCHYFLVSEQFVSLADRCTPLWLISGALYLTISEDAWSCA